MLSMGERSTQGVCELFSSVGLWEGFFGVKVTRSPYLLYGCPHLTTPTCCRSKRSSAAAVLLFFPQV